ncbi:polyisoprenoid-binding protein [Lysobacter helvus]|uniref:Polyisoprenoid-binding protein n=2 Tax=Lysobacteraceae TaxID=32033 RepID=A0ABN6FV06_9GAMM|nr:MULTISPECIES: YceI family protein [Lysobacter]BCT92805.1 polyisoprenoid-binding protein [Lysobacter caseinilyticus]BCT95958.1 polyisoprenoid-binding protein [Lysobacter helvus]
MSADRLRRFALACALLSCTAFAHAADYVQAAGSTLQFTARYQGDPVPGRFPGFTTTLRFDPQHLADARLDVTIPLASATTGNEDYDPELTGTFFESQRFPQARYTATKFRALGGNRYAADGTLSLHGASKPVTLVFTWTAGAKPVLSGTATVKRLDFGVGGGDWKQTDLVPNEVAITTKVVFTPKR